MSRVRTTILALAVLLAGLSAPANAMDGINQGVGGGAPGEGYASIQSTLLNLSRHFRETLLDRVHHVLGGGSDLWSESFAGWNRHDGTASASRLNDSDLGAFVGFDTPIVNDWRLGVAGGIVESKPNILGAATTADVKTYDATVYSGGSFAGFDLSGGLAYSLHRINLQRIVSSIDYLSSYDGRTIQVFAEAGYAFDVGPVVFEPTVGIAWVDLAHSNFAETGDSAAFTGRTSQIDLGYSELGIRVSTNADILGVHFLPRGFLGWQHVIGGTIPSVNLESNGSGSTAFGVPVVRDQAAVKLGIDVVFVPSFTASLGYDAVFAAHAQSQTVGVTLSIAL
jgi:outer membrane autotransporter protein